MLNIALPDDEALPDTPELLSTDLAVSPSEPPKEAIPETTSLLPDPPVEESGSLFDSLHLGGEDGPHEVEAPPSARYDLISIRYLPIWQLPTKLFTLSIYDDPIIDDETPSILAGLETQPNPEKIKVIKEKTTPQLSEEEINLKVQALEVELESAVTAEDFDRAGKVSSSL